MCSSSHGVHLECDISAMCVGITLSSLSCNPNASQMDERLVQLTWIDGWPDMITTLNSTDASTARPFDDIFLCLKRGDSRKKPIKILFATVHPQHGNDSLLLSFAPPPYHNVFLGDHENLRICIAGVTRYKSGKYLSLVFP